MTGLVFDTFLCLCFLLFLCFSWVLQFTCLYSIPHKYTHFYQQFGLLKGSVTMKKWKKLDCEKMKLYICFTADNKIYFIFRKALYYCIYLWRFFWWRSLTLQGCQMLATLKNHEIFNYVYSFTPMLMKFLHNTLVISPKETPTLEFATLWFFDNCEVSKFRKLIIFKKKISATSE